ncbi:MAG: carboxypeptidase-like regulatory domain-containing protein [Chitinophagaceae bacterium]|nr:carboxypeptidase-like regulatory domain-containing protein [Chitinophagaceae bacterium]MCW5904607.1 carboxypeptidase-like regulatory domain-containing protein [Chitinophagaceae bacterium]
MKDKKNISKLFLTLLFCFHFSFAYSQVGIIKGKVIDNKTKEIIIGAAVLLDNTSVGILTDNKGEFVIPKVLVGTHKIITSFISYKTKTINHIVVKEGETTLVEIALEAEYNKMDEVVIVSKSNKESENELLRLQKKSLVATQSIGAAELSRKGIGDAESAVSSMSGISKQDGVKNVFVRGLGDRYNATLLNGLPVPSEDPEYKNIALSFFETDIIKNIDVDKVFSVQNNSDVGGAIIDIKSKELIKDYSFGLSVSTGFNTKAIGTNYKKADGFNYFGFANFTNPESGKFNFNNSLDPLVVKLPINESYRLSAGKKFQIGNNVLSFFVVATHASEYSYTEEIVRNTTTDGTVYQDQTGQKYSGKKSQLVLANLNYDIGRSNSISYNFMMLHATNFYIGEYNGKHAERFQDAANDIGYVRRQQVNDNLLFTHQIISKWRLADKWNMNVDASVNQIKGFEPDRRENYLSQKADGTYGLTGSNRQKRFFSELNEQSFNTKFFITYKLTDVLNSANSKISFGYNGHNSTNSFNATEYNFSAISGSYSIDNLLLDKLYNSNNFKDKIFSFTQSYPSTYSVLKNNHSFFVTAAYQISKKLSGLIGFKYDNVDMKVIYDVPGQTDNNTIQTSFYLPSINLKYDINKKNILRLGLSKTYTLPQSKEISPFQYVNIGFASEGNPHIQYSDNYNVDIKWDNYLSSSELMSITIFYKKILNPIGRVDKGNSAGLLTYDNIGKDANVMGIEAEYRKDIFKKKNNDLLTENKLSIGTNFSYILTSTKLNLINTPERISALEGASPFIINADITYHYLKAKKGLTTSLVFNYFGDRIFTIGAMGYQDIIEKGIPTIDFIFSYRLSKMLGIKFKAANFLDPNFQLSRKVSNTNKAITLSQYKKGVNLNVGINIDL